MQAGVYEANDISKIWSVKLGYKKIKTPCKLKCLATNLLTKK